jgi:hypothetical protein
MTKENSHSSSEHLLLDLGLHPVSNRFLPVDAERKIPRFPIRLLLNYEMGLIRLETPFPVNEVKPRYPWLSSLEPEEHLDELVSTITCLPNISTESIFAAYSYKEDSTLERLKTSGFNKVWRINPEKDLLLFDPCSDLETFQNHLTVDNIQNIRARHGRADVFIVRHAIEHAYDLPQFVSSIRAMTKPDGYIVWEIPDCSRALGLGDCSILWEEHTYYFTEFTFKQLLLSLGLEVVYYQSFDYPLENSIVAISKNSEMDSKEIVLQSDPTAIATEIKRAHGFVKTIETRRLSIRQKMIRLRERYHKIALLGAGHLAVAFLSIMEISDLITHVLDDNPYKRGMIFPVGDFRILGSDALYLDDIKVCLLGLNPRTQNKVIAKNKKFTDAGGIFASIFPGNELSFEEIL